MGIPWAEAQLGGSLLGVKTILNEFVPYVDLAAIDASDLSERSRIIMLYALCGLQTYQASVYCSVGWVQ
ncbi:MAG: hypothetical protein Ct9H300mP4_15900 [Gammaproteobacteria bacterium]|nr:MAG: hypothetical protein Ct9H300mP4_15900 [Gammaproteobacteria bacterium]